MKRMNNKQKFLVIIVIFLIGITFGLSAFGLLQYSIHGFKSECLNCTESMISRDRCNINFFNENIKTTGNCSRYGLYMIGIDIAYISGLIALFITGLSFLVIVNLIVISELKRIGYFNKIIIKK